MLRASSPTTVLVHLPQALPQDFVMEFDFVPKLAVNSEDFHVEGTRNPDQGDFSAVLMWYSSNVRVVGGAPAQFDAPMPSALYGVLAGALTRVSISVQGTVMRVYTNGQLTHTIPNRKFVRAPFLRLFLGGEDDDQNAVYLASLRVADLGFSTATNSSALGGANVPGQQPGAGGSGGQPVGSSGGTGSGTLGPNSSGTTSGNAPVPIAIANLTVTDTPAGPVVSWLGVPSAVYMVQRWLMTDPTCCANTSPASPALTSPPWQDMPLPVSGTYVYSVTATTSSGSTSAQVQFTYQRSGTGQTIPPPTPGTRPTASPMPTPSSTTTGTNPPPSSTSGTTATSPTTSTASTAATLPAASPTATGGTVTNAGRYRVTLTGFRAHVATLENPASADGSGDEVYAAAAAIVWDRSTSTVRSRSTVNTREYGQLVNAATYSNRIQAGTMTTSGGIWTNNGAEQIPAQYDPSGSSIPAHTTDRFPLLVWEGVLQDGVEAVLVIPTLWERDLDPSLHSLWASKWNTMALPQHILSPPVMAALGATQLSYVPLGTPGLPIAVPIPDVTANLRDLPIGMVPNPPAAPVGADYVDRHVFITREKLGALQTVGSATVLPIAYSVPTSIVARGSYTLYLRIERVQ
jgi:hypothetical protein